MKELYFINLLGNISTAAWVLFGVFAFILMCVGIWNMMEYPLDDDEKKTSAKWIKMSIIAMAITMSLGVAIPSKSDLYVIYGVGTAIDWVQDSDQAKQLPEKTVRMLNALADKYAEENTKNE